MTDIFRKGEHPFSNAYIRKLNELVSVVNQIKTLKGYNGITVKHTPNSIAITMGRTRSGGGGTGESSDSGVILFGEVTETLAYPTESDAGVATYTVTVTDPYNPSADLSSVHPLMFNMDETRSGYDDLRNYLPWLAEGEVVALTTYGGQYYFLGNFVFVGNPTEKSLSWNDSEGRAMACFR